MKLLVTLVTYAVFGMIAGCVAHKRGISMPARTEHFNEYMAINVISIILGTIVCGALEFPKTGGFGGFVHGVAYVLCLYYLGGNGKDRRKKSRKGGALIQKLLEKIKELSPAPQPKPVPAK
jgi:hypothetical protein